MRARDQRSDESGSVIDLGGSDVTLCIGKGSLSGEGVYILVVVNTKNIMQNPPQTSEFQ